MLDAVNSMLMEMLAAIAHKDWMNRRRQREGIELAKRDGRYKTPLKSGGRVAI